MNQRDPGAASTRDFLVVGRDVPRTDAVPKVTGAAQYVADMHLPGMLHAAVLRSPHPHARVVAIDTSAAAATPGVKAVLTGEDTARVKWGAFRPDLYPLAIGKVRYVGDEVAAVAATDPAIARAAVDKIVVQYEVLPAVLSLNAALAPGAPLVHDDAPGNVAHHFNFERGDVDAGFRASDITVEGTWESSRQWHIALETIGCVATWASGRVTMWCNTQTPFLARGRYAKALDVPEAQVRVIQTEVGGGFGGKSGDDNASVVCALLARRTGRPVKLIHTREEEFLASHPRMPMRYWVRLGFRRDGKVMAKEIKMLADNGAYTGKSQAILGAASVRHDALYKYPCARGDSTLVYTNLVPTGAFRGFGNPSADWAVEQAWDLAAEKLGIDVVDLLRMNAVEPGDVSPHNHKITSCELRQCIDKAAEAIGWREKKQSARRTSVRPAPGASEVEARSPVRPEHSASAVEARSPVRPERTASEVEARSPVRPERSGSEVEGRTDNHPRGLGMGCSVHVNGRRSFGDWDGSSAIVRVNEDGRATVITGEGEIGQGALTVLRQIAAEQLGLAYEDVDITRPDTDVQPHSLGALASRVTYVGGNAVKRAAASAGKQLMEAAAEQLERPVDELTIINGEIGPKGGPESEFRPVAAIVRANIYKRDGQPIIGVGAWDNPSDFPDHSRYGNESGAYNFAAQAVEVEVDRDTGVVNVLEIAAAVDCGTVIHPAAAEGQVQGAVAQGMGYAMIEYLDWHNGTPTDPNFIDHPVPGAAMMPKMHVIFADSYEPSGPYGAKGLGEIGLDAIPAAIANAIADAVGVRITELPITAEKVHRALHPELYANETKADTGPKGAVWSRITAGRPAGARSFNPELIVATSVQEAVALLAEGDSALVCGGMSHAVRRERTGYPQAKRLVAINRIPELNEYTVDSEGVLRAGAAIHHQTLYEDARLKETWRAIYDAAASVGHARIRRMMSVGGTLGPLIGGFDLPVALIALHGRVVVAAAGGRRTVTLEELFEKRLGKDEMIVSFEVDTPAARSGSSFLKHLPRRVIETPSVNTAAHVELDASGRCKSARVVVGSVSWKPIVLDLAQCAGQMPDDALFRAAVQPVRDLAEPIANVRGSALYKRHMAVEFAFRALRQAARHAQRGAAG